MVDICFMMQNYVLVNKIISYKNCICIQQKAINTSMKNKLSRYDSSNNQKKHIMWNLNELLNHNAIITKSPQEVPRMHSRIQPRHSQTADSCGRNQKNSKYSNSQIKNVTALKMNFQLYRTKSSLKLKNKYNQIKHGQKIDSLHLNNNNNRQFSKHIDKPKDINMLRNTDKNNENRVDIRGKKQQFERYYQSMRPSVQGIGLQNSYRSQQMFSNQNIRNSNYVFRQQFYANNNFMNLQPQIITRSVEIKRKISQPCSYQNKNKLFPNSSNLTYEKKNFLKKGSSLQKQIVVNLLKNKMLKQHEFDVKRQYTNQDILSMIKLYKGFCKQSQQIKVIEPSIIEESENQKIPNLRSKPVSSSSNYFKNKNSKENPEENIKQSCPLKIIEKFQKPFEGWEIQPEFQYEVTKHMENDQNLINNSHQPQ